MFGTYCRLNVHCMDSNVTVIRAARKALHKKARRDPALRENRKAFYRAILAEHANARAVFNTFRF
jgi:hypothetical protein